MIPIIINITGTRKSKLSRRLFNKVSRKVKRIIVIIDAVNIWPIAQLMLKNPVCCLDDERVNNPETATK